jgi:hypothetical protein
MAVINTAAGTVQVTKNTIALPYAGVTPLLDTSVSDGGTEVVAALTPPMGETAFLAGLIVTGTALTGVTLSGILGDEPVTFTGTAINFSFNPPIPSEGTDMPIVATCPGGEGNSILIWGFSSIPSEMT